jgi:hypothetical protein
LKFGADYGGASFNNSVLYNRYQPYGGGQGPINLSSNSVLNGLIRLGTSELMEDIKITGAFKLSTNLKDNEWLMNYQNLKRRIDWGTTYYRNAISATNGKIFTNLYQASAAYPFDNSKRIKLDVGYRSDKSVFFTDINDINSLGFKDYVSGGVIEYNTPVDLAGFTARMQIRATIDSTVIIQELTTSNGAIAINNTNKTITLTIPPEVTAAYTFSSAVYSLEMISNGGQVTPFCNGTITLVKEVTR